MHFHSFMEVLIVYDNAFYFRFYVYFFILFHITNKIWIFKLIVIKQKFCEVTKNENNVSIEKLLDNRN